MPPHDKNPRMAGERTRQKLRDAGIDAAIADKPDLTMDEATEALAAMEAQAAQEVRGPIPELHQFVYMEDETDVVGESFYAENLRFVWEKHHFRDRKAYAWATLRPEPDNPYDNNAVGVYVDNLKVGHLSGDDAEDCHDILALVEQNLGIRVCCSCTILGPGPEHFGVYLDFSVDELIEELGLDDEFLKAAAHHSQMRETNPAPPPNKPAPKPQKMPPPPPQPKPNAVSKNPILQQRVGCCSSVLFIFFVLLLIGQCSQAPGPQDYSVDTTASAAETPAPVPTATPTPTPAPPPNYQELYQQVVSAAMNQDANQLRFYLKVAEDNRMTTIVQQAKQAGYYDWLAISQAAPMPTASAPTQTPVDARRAAQVAVAMMEEQGYFMGYSDSQKTLLVNPQKWQGLSVPDKEKVIRLMAIALGDGSQDPYVSFTVRDGYTNDKVASYSPWSGVKIGSN